MKQLLLIILAAFLPLSAFSLNADGPQNKQEIPLSPVYDGHQNRDNRSLIQLPIECYYESFTNLIQTSVTSDLGYVVVEVLNTSTGETLCTTFDSEIIPQTYLPISGAPGLYLITYTTESGDIYEGILNLN